MAADFTYSLAQHSHIAEIENLINLAISEPQKDQIDQDQIDASREQMGLDISLINDQTYFVILDGDVIVGCGGWGRRQTLYGGDDTDGRDDRLLDPAHDAARLRAMYCHPDWTRRGIGRMIIDISEKAAKDAGFNKMILSATISGAPLYKACGYKQTQQYFEKSKGGIDISHQIMIKNL